ncbi:MAG: hypothetical protein ACOH1N_12235 [Lutibacter sp.]
MKNKVILIGLLFCNIILLKAQSTNQFKPFTLPPPPEAYSLFKFNEIPVSLTTGVPSINIPVYEIKLTNFSLPISLKYNSSGIRVDEIASNVGLGWALEAGGMISSSIVGGADFGANGFMDSPDFPEDRELEPILKLELPGGWVANDDYSFCMQVAGNPIMSNSMNSTTTLPVLDTQPDIFYYSFAGRSGKFFHKKDGSIHTFPYQPIEINREGYYKYVIKDENGNIFTFDVIENIQTSSMNYTTHSDFGGGGNYELNKTFYLSKIQTPLGEIINLVYRDVSYRYQLPTSYTRYRQMNTNYGFPETVDTRTELTSLVHSKILESITSNKSHKIDFEYEICPRLDMPAFQSYPTSLSGNFALKKIKITRGNKIETVMLNQGYFSANTYQPCTVVANSNDYRLKLLSVQRDGEPPYQFEYFGNNALPNRLSDQSSDHWGYYSTNGSRFVKDLQYGFTGSDRNPNLIQTKQGVLTKIKYPTGGVSLFEYELNRANDMISSNGQTIQHFHDIYYDESQSVQYKNFTINQNVNKTNIQILYFTTPAPAQASPQFNVRLTGPGIDRFFQSESEIGSEFLLLQNGDYILSVEQIGEFENGFVKLIYYETTPSTSEKKNIEVGGLRIKKIIDFNTDGASPSFVRRFEYVMPEDESISSGKLANIPEYVYPYTKGRRVISDDFIIDYYGNYWVQNSNSVLPLSGLQGYHIMYTNVRMYKDELKEHGYTDYVFSFVNDLKSYITFPATLATSYDWQRGLLLEEKSYSFDAVSNQYKPVKETKNYYKFNYTPPSYLQNFSESGAHYTPPVYPNESHVLGLNVLNLMPEARLINCISCDFKRSSATFQISSYKLISSWHYLEATTEKQYDQNGLNAVTTTTNYYYNNPVHSQLSLTEVTLANGKALETKISYPDDVLLTTSLGADKLEAYEKVAIDQLKIGAQHRIAEPVQVETTVKDILGTVLSTSIQRTNYKDWGSNLILPESIETLKGTYSSSTNKLEDRIVYSKYDNKGNPLEVSKKDGSHIVYIWGYQEQYPVAKVENATYADVSSFVSNIQTKSNLDVDSATEQTLRISLASLRTALPNSLVTTYTYDPLIGVTSITDPRGQTIYYHYDAFNRLEYLLDKDGKVISKNEYHYKNQ